MKLLVDLILAGGPTVVFVTPICVRRVVARLRIDKTLATRHVHWRLEGYAQGIDRHLSPAAVRAISAPI